MMRVVKRNGEVEEYDEGKVIRALKRVGADDNTIREVLKEVKPYIYDLITTRELYALVFKSLERIKPAIATLYGLKEGLAKLGPSGYPFERFVGRIFEKLGYRIAIGKIVDGKCVSHEVDVIAEREGERVMAECKHHENFETKVDVKISMYVVSRFNDIKWVYRDVKPFLITNTKFTQDAIRFSKCYGLNLLGWNYPEGEGLEYLIHKTQTFPITILKIDEKTANKLFNEGIITIKDLLGNRKKGEELGINPDIFKICEGIIQKQIPQG